MAGPTCKIVSWRLIAVFFVGSRLPLLSDSEVVFSADPAFPSQPEYFDSQFGNVRIGLCESVLGLLGRC